MIFLTCKRNARQFWKIKESRELPLQLLWISGCPILCRACALLHHLGWLLCCRAEDMYQHPRSLLGWILQHISTHFTCEHTHTKKKHCQVSTGLSRNRGSTSLAGIWRDNPTHWSVLGLGPSWLQASWKCEGCIYVLKLKHYNKQKVLTLERVYLAFGFIFWLEEESR